MEKEKQMPARSKKQQKLMAIAKNEPEKVYAKNRGVLKMKKSQLKEFAQTKRKGLPSKVKRKK